MIMTIREWYDSLDTPPETRDDILDAIEEDYLPEFEAAIWKMTAKPQNMNRVIIINNNPVSPAEPFPNLWGELQSDAELTPSEPEPEPDPAEVTVYEQMASEEKPKRGRPRNV